MKTMTPQEWADHLAEQAKLGIESLLTLAKNKAPNVDQGKIIRDLKDVVRMIQEGFSRIGAR